MTRTLPTMSPIGPSTGCTSAKGSAKAVVSSATAFGSTPMSCAIGGMIGSVAREASATMKPIRLNRAIRPRARSSGSFLAGSGSGFGAAGNRFPSSGLPESNLGWKFIGWQSHTRISAPVLCSAGMPHPTIAWGRNREVFLVIGLKSSRTESPHGLPAAIQEPMAA